MHGYQPSEKEIQDSILEYLRLKGFYCQRLNSGKIAVGGNRYVALGVAGTPDILAFKRPGGVPLFPDTVRLYFIEVKKPKKKPTPVQEAKMQELEEYGAICFVATSIEDVIEKGL